MRVLIVDDSALIGERLRALLAEIEGLEVVGQAGDVAAAEEAIARMAPDAVILDLQLANGSGLTVLRHLRRSSRKVLVIVLTNHAHPHYRRGCLAEGADHFLDKSLDFEAVAKILEQAAAG